ncbi:MAG: hypothetical protein CSA20_07895 [Deltaproteobacteria bacterium]|nr:MAG: hypothetical protein CSA20_07895 [Deltaproteobacteria bacterium]
MKSRNSNSIELSLYLQMLSADRKTCAVLVEKGMRIGMLCLCDGQPFDAQSKQKGKAAEEDRSCRYGEQAIYEMLGWHEPRIEVLPLERSVKRNIDKSLEFLLLESCRIADEQADLEQDRSVDRQVAVRNEDSLFSSPLFQEGAAGESGRVGKNERADDPSAFESESSAIAGPGQFPVRETPSKPEDLISVLSNGIVKKIFVTVVLIIVFGTAFFMSPWGRQYKENAELSSTDQVAALVQTDIRNPVNSRKDGQGSENAVSSGPGKIGRSLTGAEHKLPVSGKELTASGEPLEQKRQAGKKSPGAVKRVSEPPSPAKTEAPAISRRASKTALLVETEAPAVSELLSRSGSIVQKKAPTTAKRGSEPQSVVQKEPKAQPPPVFNIELPRFSRAQAETGSVVRLTSPAGKGRSESQQKGRPEFASEPAALSEHVSQSSADLIAQTDSQGPLKDSRTFPPSAVQAVDAASPSSPKDIALAIREVGAAIDKYKRYPRAARRAGYGGLVKVQIQLKKNGMAVACSILKSSGRKALDRAAMNAAQKIIDQKVTSAVLSDDLFVIVPVRFSLD